MPAVYQRYIRNWAKLCEGYRIKEWNEKNFPLSRSKYATEAYRTGKWAFVSDYVRFRVLYEYGGICLDTDVELQSSLDSIIKECEDKDLHGFMGIERAETGEVNPGLICGSEPKNPFIKELILEYKNRSFSKELEEKNIATVVNITTNALKRYGLNEKNELQDIAGFRIYPAEYFSPIDMSTGKLRKTKNTVSIHHFAASWVDPYSRLRGKIYKGIRRCFGEKISEKVRKIVGRQ